MATYTVKYGDTLAGIAAKNNTTAAALAAANNISDPNKIQSGSTLNLSAVAPPPVTAVPTPAPAPFTGGQTAEQMANAFKASGQSPVPQTPTSGAITTADLNRGTQMTDPSTLVASAPQNNLSDMVSKVASSTLDSTGKAVDALLAQREADQKAAVSAAQANVSKDTGDINTLKDNVATADQNALSSIYAKFGVDNTIASLQATNLKITAAQEALNMGLIYEQDRPVREQLIVGRTASLQKQGLATIGALQSTAQILQGNLDLAKSYAQTTIDAINTDNSNTMTALQTLLKLHNDDLVQLTSDEKATVDQRIKAIQDQDGQLQKNKDDLFTLLSNYPTAAIKGGVTLLDDRESALSKMLPQMSSMELTKFNADLAATNRSNAGTTNSDGSAADKQQLLGLKSQGMTYQEALNAFSDTVSTTWINAVYREDNTPSDPTTSVNNIIANQFIDPATGQLKDGYTVGFNDQTGAPQIKQAAPASSGGGFWSKIGSFFSGVWK